MKRRCCFLSMDSLEGYVSDDELAIPTLNSLGWEVETLSWRAADADWDRFAIVVIRTTWDYQRDPERFLDVLAAIESSPAKLENSLETVRWNLDKSYLRSLDAAGIRTVPAIWEQDYDETSFSAWLHDLDAGELVIKPTISATAELTYRLSEFDPALRPVFADRPFLVQPFMQNIIDEGEHSLFFFSGEFSHAILKTPKQADFRVQEEHGGIITAARPEERMLAAAKAALHVIGQEPLYARVDLVRTENDEFAVMELELIEPALYFRMDDAAPYRFAAALNARAL